MTLGNALQIGRTGLLTAQTAVEVTGENLANLSTPGYHRRRVEQSALPSQEIQGGIFVGRGVQIEAISRQIDEALETRLRGSIADESGSATLAELLAQIEAVENEFSDADLSTRLGAYFNAWSQLANNPQDLSLRTLLAQESASLSTFIKDLDGELKSLRLQTDRSIEQAVATVDDVLTRIEQINDRIAVADHGTGGASSLRDQRDRLLTELAGYLDVSTVEQESGKIDLFVGSLPLMLNGKSRGIASKTETVNGVVETSVVVAADSSVLDISSGRIGALVKFRQSDLDGAIDTLDTFAGQLIFQTNRLHSQGQGLIGRTSHLATNRVLDTTVALTDPLTELEFTPGHGSFEIHLVQKSTGQRTTSVVTVDLDGIGGADTTLTSLAADIGALANISATITTDGRLQIDSAGADFEVSFSADTSGALAALGIGSFFTGTDAFDIDVRTDLLATPGLIAAAQDHLAGDNGTALAIAGLRELGVTELGGLSLTQYWNRHVEDYAVRLSQARSQREADSVVRGSLETQQQSVSGVNADEEAINLLRYQRSYQASARFLTVVDELMQTLLSLA